MPAEMLYLFGLSLVVQLLVVIRYRLNKYVCVLGFSASCPLITVGYEHAGGPAGLFAVWHHYDFSLVSAALAFTIIPIPSILITLILLSSGMLKESRAIAWYVIISGLQVLLLLQSGGFSAHSICSSTPSIVWLSLLVFTHSKARIKSVCRKIDKLRSL